MRYLPIFVRRPGTMYEITHYTVRFPEEIKDGSVGDIFGKWEYLASCTKRGWYGCCFRYRDSK